AEALRLLYQEGLLWVEADAVQVSRQALSERLERLPATLFAGLFGEVVQRLCLRSSARPWVWPAWMGRYEGSVYIADASTLEALRRRLDAAQEPEHKLGGKMLVVVEAFGHVPQALWFTSDVCQNEKVWSEELLTFLPAGGLLVFDLGFFGFGFLDAFTAGGKFFVTRLREKTAYDVVNTLAQGPRFRDQIIQMGCYRSNPCKYPVRMVSVLWKGTWYRY